MFVDYNKKNLVITLIIFISFCTAVTVIANANCIFCGNLFEKLCHSSLLCARGKRYRYCNFFALSNSFNPVDLCSLCVYFLLLLLIFLTHICVGSLVVLASFVVSLSFRDWLDLMYVNLYNYLLKNNYDLTNDYYVYYCLLTDTYSFSFSTSIPFISYLMHH
eukprot:484899_1